MRWLQGLRSIGVWSLSIAILTFFLTSDAGTKPTQATTDSHIAADVNGGGGSRIAGEGDADAARWKGGELVAPLPADPAKRAEAIRLAKESGRERASSSGITPAIGVQATQGLVQPQKVHTLVRTAVSRDAGRKPARSRPVPREPDVEPFVPTAEQLREAAQIPNIVIDPAMAPAAPGVMGSFGAVDFTGWTPPSPDIAVGPEHVLVATTDVFAVYDKCGDWVDGGDFGEYFAAGSNFTYYDPRVVYDDWSGRWVMAYIATDFTGDIARVVVGISVSANLEDGWDCRYDLGMTVGDWADNMYMAVDPEGLYLSFNQYTFASYAFDGAIVIALDKPAMYDCGPTATYVYTGLLNPGDGSDAFAIRPAQMHTYPGQMYFLNSKYEGGTLFTLWSLADLGAAIVPSSITTSAYVLPPPMRQPDGTYVRGGDCRINDLVYDEGALHAVYTSYVNQGGTDYSRLSMRKFTTSPAGLADAVDIYNSGYYISYQSLDIDEYGRVGLCYAQCSYVNSLYLTVSYFVWDWLETSIIDLGTVAPGQANFTIGGAGTIGNPYRWGNYTGCAVDPVDDRTLWVVGAFASDSPTPSWDTQVAAVSAFPESYLTFEPPVSYTGGMQGGPFVKEVLPVTLSNTGETGLNWEINSYPWWVTPSAMQGEIPPGGSQVVSFLLNQSAQDLPVGVYNEPVEFTNCTGGLGGSCTLHLTVVEPVVCPTSSISLAPPIGDATALFGSGEYSLFVTAMEDIDVCTIGLMLAHAEPLDLTCYVYEADGTTRGPLVHSNTEAAVQDADGTYLVPMEMSLEACHDYEIVFTHPSSIAHASYDENDFSYPFDANGLLRVRQSATDGSVGDTQHPGIVVFGHASCDPVLDHTTDLYVEATEHTETSTNSTQGLFITARENLYLCSIGFEADLVRDRWLIAGVWEATGNTREAFVANGFLPVQTGGLAAHEVPIHVLLQAGQDYNISVEVSETGYWPAVAEGEVSLPYMVDDVIEVRKSERDGVASTDLPHIWLNWEDVASRGAPFDLAKSSDGIPPPYTTTGPIDHGAFVEPAATQDVYSLGVHADIPEGTTIIARIYKLTGAGTRGALETEGVIESGGSGMRWHDVPVALTWSGGSRYDLSIVCANVTELGYWDATTGMPYSPYGGTIQVQEAESSGNASKDLIHLRVNACDDVMTAVEDRPPRFVPLSLEAPVPNPANGLVSLRYSVDVSGTAGLEIYDVSGRRVARVFSGRHVAAGPGAVEYDASGLSSGVYFLRLTAGGKAVARKIVVTR